MNSYASADQSPVGALLRRGADESREPFQRRGNAATVNQGDDQFVISARHVNGICDGLIG